MASRSTRNQSAPNRSADVDGGRVVGERRDRTDAASLHVRTSAPRDYSQQLAGSHPTAAAPSRWPPGRAVGPIRSRVRTGPGSSRCACSATILRSASGSRTPRGGRGDHRNGPFRAGEGPATHRTGAGHRHGRAVAAARALSRPGHGVHSRGGADLSRGRGPSGRHGILIEHFYLGSKPATRSTAITPSRQVDYFTTGRWGSPEMLTLTVPTGRHQRTLS